MPTLMSLAKYAYPDVEMSGVIAELIEGHIVPCLVYCSVQKSVGNVRSVHVMDGVDASVRGCPSGPGVGPDGDEGRL
jgi:hypothetical protein